jgi:hypothetical protein
MNKKLGMSWKNGRRLKSFKTRIGWKRSSNLEGKRKNAKRWDFYGDTMLRYDVPVRKVSV